MMDVKKLKGTAVIAVAGGEKIGEVEDVLLDGSGQRVESLTVTSGGFRRHKRSVLPFSAVGSIGADAVMIADAHALQPDTGTAPPAGRPASALDKLRVVTESGAYLGNVETAHIDPASGAVLDFEVGSSRFGGLLGKNTVVQANAITSLGADIMVVPNNLADAASEAPPQG